MPDKPSLHPALSYLLALRSTLDELVDACKDRDLPAEVRGNVVYALLEADGKLEEARAELLKP